MQAPSPQILRARNGSTRQGARFARIAMKRELSQRALGSVRPLLRLAQQGTTPKARGAASRTDSAGGQEGAEDRDHRGGAQDVGGDRLGERRFAGGELAHGLQAGGFDFGFGSGRRGGGDRVGFLEADAAEDALGD